MAGITQTDEIRKDKRPTATLHGAVSAGPSGHGAEAMAAPTPKPQQVALSGKSWRRSHRRISLAGRSHALVAQREHQRQVRGRPRGSGFGAMQDGAIEEQ